VNDIDAKRDEAIARAEEHADQNWMVWAAQATYICARQYTQFTVDDVWQTLEDIWPDSDTHEHRAMGPVMRRAQREGWIKATAKWQDSKRKSRNRGPVRVWLSNLGKEDE
jgi:hypothetical protein